MDHPDTDDQLPTMLPIIDLTDINAEALSSPVLAAALTRILSPDTTATIAAFSNRL